MKLDKYDKFLEGQTRFYYVFVNCTRQDTRTTIKPCELIETKLYSCLYLYIRTDLLASQVFFGAILSQCLCITTRISYKPSMKRAMQLRCQLLLHLIQNHFLRPTVDFRFKARMTSDVIDDVLATCQALTTSDVT